MREGHGSRASASGHVVVLQKRQETEFLSATLNLKTLHVKLFTENSVWEIFLAHGERGQPI